MTQDNGVWCSPVLSQLHISDYDTKKVFDWHEYNVRKSSYNSHLEQHFDNAELKISQKLFYSSAHSAIILTKITNQTEGDFLLQPSWKGTTFLRNLQLEKQVDSINIYSGKNTAKGYLRTFGDEISGISVSDSAYTLNLKTFELKPGETRELILTQSFIFPEYDYPNVHEDIKRSTRESEALLQSRILQKKSQLQSLFNKLRKNYQDSVYQDLVAKVVLTMQNNWRIPAGELKHSGLFPSYHYIWFHGFWAWDSWKHAVALVHYDPVLAKEQVRAMYDFMDEDGFIADCVYRDTTIENHNYRNTKPPLSAWAVWNIYDQDKDVEFAEEMYPKIKLQHKWWYANRDHDQDGLCEYGCTDGTLIAAKWESGMDNAVRFDDSQILKNSDRAYSLNQESVDLNAYLFAEKNYLAELALAIGKQQDTASLKKQADTLKYKIQNQFYDVESGWFYDTSIDGKAFIKSMGSEGWIPLWAKVASEKQAEAVRKNIMLAKNFNTKVPLQTLSASHPKFKPDGGYWRGPTWLDQAYFGVIGLRNYGFAAEADQLTHKLIHNAEGVLEHGKSIRENYNPVTGAGLESENFSWSATHYLLLMLSE